MELSEEFKNKTVLLKKILKEVKLICDENEEAYHNETRDLMIQYVNKLKNKYFPIMDQYFLDLTIMAMDFDGKSYELHKNFLRKELFDFFANKNAPQNYQIGTKPLGYAGDYIVANYFYDDDFSGKNLFGMFMDRYTLDSKLARAHINRRFYLGKLILKLSKKKNNQELNVTSFACGPAPEVFDVLGKGVKNVKFNLLDGEEGVIKFLNERIVKCGIDGKKIKLYLKNILNLIRKNEELDMAKQDLIYCAGFFDYIRETTAKKFITYMLKYLKKNGWLIIVNVSEHDANNVYLKMLGEWELYHRSKNDLLRMIKDIEFVKQKRVLYDFNTKRNLYLVVKRQ